MYERVFIGSLRLIKPRVAQRKWGLFLCAEPRPRLVLTPRPESTLVFTITNTLFGGIFFLFLRDKESNEFGIGSNRSFLFRLFQVSWIQEDEFFDRCAVRSRLK